MDIILCCFRSTHAVGNHSRLVKPLTWCLFLLLESDEKHGEVSTKDCRRIHTSAHDYRKLCCDLELGPIWKKALLRIFLNRSHWRHDELVLVITRRIRSRQLQHVVKRYPCLDPFRLIDIHRLDLVPQHSNRSHGESIWLGRRKQLSVLEQRVQLVHGQLWSHRAEVQQRAITKNKVHLCHKNCSSRTWKKLRRKSRSSARIALTRAARLVSAIERNEQQDWCDIDKPAAIALCHGETTGQELTAPAQVSYTNKGRKVR